MKTLLTALTALAMFGIAVGANAQKDAMAETFTGEILSTACVSHKKLATKTEINEAQECTDHSGKAATYVLYDPDTRMTYEFTDQKQVAKFAGKGVTVVGYVDISSRAIQVAEITPGS